MEEFLEDIFLMIDNDAYIDAEVFIKDFRKKYDGMGMPSWVGETHAQISRAEAMLACLSTPLTEEENETVLCSHRS